VPVWFSSPQTTPKVVGFCFARLQPQRPNATVQADKRDILELTTEDVLELTTAAGSAKEEGILELTAVAGSTEDEAVLELTAVAESDEDEDILYLTAELELHSSPRPKPNKATKQEQTQEPVSNGPKRSAERTREEIIGAMRRFISDD
jgi:hypothetical protein